MLLCVYVVKGSNHLNLDRNFHKRALAVHVLRITPFPNILCIAEYIISIL